MPQVQNQRIARFTYVCDVTVMRLLPLAGSNELNPLTRGKFKNSSKAPTWPWLHGTPVQPKGVVCRLCTWCFMLGGFGSGKDACKDMDDLHAKMKDNAAGTLTDTWMEVQRQAITNINAGKITQRLRGNKRANIMESLTASRRKVLESGRLAIL